MRPKPRSLRCRIGLHHWAKKASWLHDPTLYPSWIYGLRCDRCLLAARQVQYPAPTSSSFLDRLSQPAIERAERRAGTAVTVRGVPHRIVEVSTRRSGETYWRTEVIEPESALKGGASS